MDQEQRLKELERRARLALLQVAVQVPVHDQVDQLGAAAEAALARTHQPARLVEIADGLDPIAERLVLEVAPGIGAVHLPVHRRAADVLDPLQQPVRVAQA